MGNGTLLAEAGDDAAALRRTGRNYLQMVAASCGEEYGVSWAWNSFGLWIPPEDTPAAFSEMQQIFGSCTPDAPATVEILWKAPRDTAPAWYRIHIMDTFADRARPAMRGSWANPAADLVELSDVAAVRPSVEGLPLSCTGTESTGFRPSFFRPAAEPEELLPQLMMTRAEAELMTELYLHQESHRLGPLWPTVDAQAAATRDRLLGLATAAGATGTRTDINITVAVRDASVPQCPHHVYDPAPAYTHLDETRTVGLHAVAHAHRDGTVGLEEHSGDHLQAVLTCLAL